MALTDNCQNAAASLKFPTSDPIQHLIARTWRPRSALSMDRPYISNIRCSDKAFPKKDSLTSPSQIGRMPIFARNLETSPEVQGRQISSGKEKRRWITWYRILMVGSLPSISKVVVGTQQWRSKTRAFKIDAMNQTLPRYHNRRSSCSHICSHEVCTNSPDISSQPLLTWSCSRGNRFSLIVANWWVSLIKRPPARGGRLLS